MVQAALVLPLAMSRVGDPEPVDAQNAEPLVDDTADPAGARRVAHRQRVVQAQVIEEGVGGVGAFHVAVALVPTSFKAPPPAVDTVAVTPSVIERIGCGLVSGFAVPIWQA